MKDDSEENRDSSDIEELEWSSEALSGIYFDSTPNRTDKFEIVHRQTVRKPLANLDLNCSFEKPKMKPQEDEKPTNDEKLPSPEKKVRWNDETAVPVRESLYYKITPTSSAVDAKDNSSKARRKPY